MNEEMRYNIFYNDVVSKFASYFVCEFNSPLWRFIILHRQDLDMILARLRQDLD